MNNQNQQDDRNSQSKSAEVNAQQDAGTPRNLPPKPDYVHESAADDNKHELGAHRDNQNTYRNDKEAWKNVTLPEEQGMDNTIEKQLENEADLDQEHRSKKRR